MFARMLSVWSVLRLWFHPAAAWRARKARMVLAVLRSFEGEHLEQRRFAYLRKVDPYVFESMVLEALRDVGVVPLHSLRVSGDGGLDGRFWHPKLGWGCLQAKRYGKHISARHLENFVALVERRGDSLGLFAHTGRTGELAWSFANGSRVQVLSGGRLLALLVDGRL